MAEQPKIVTLSLNAALGHTKLTLYRPRETAQS